MSEIEPPSKTAPETTSEPATTPPLYHLGCPIFANAKWLGGFFPRGTKRDDFLKTYAQTFTTVEGNGVFYGLPQRSTVEKWIAETPDDFRFALKFPRAISHDSRLRDREHTRAFLRLLKMLAEGNRLGPSFLQLPPSFGPESVPELIGYLQQLPSEFPYAVEVRHVALLNGSDAARELSSALGRLRVNQVMLDTRPVYSRRSETDTEGTTRRQKPNVPVQIVETGPHPFVRLIGLDRIEDVEFALDYWVEPVAEWIEAGRQPYFFCHTPDDTFCPDLAFRFHHKLRARLPELPELTPPSPPPDDSPQLSLF